jgi:hypothetical protein
VPGVRVVELVLAREFPFRLGPPARHHWRYSNRRAAVPSILHHTCIHPSPCGYTACAVLVGGVWVGTPPGSAMMVDRAAS